MKKSSATNNRSLDFVQTRSLITLINDNHMDNYRKDILAFVHYGSVVNNQPKNDSH